MNENTKAKHHEPCIVGKISEDKTECVCTLWRSSNYCRNSTREATAKEWKANQWPYLRRHMCICTYKYIKMYVYTYLLVYIICIYIYYTYVYIYVGFCVCIHKSNPSNLSINQFDVSQHCSSARPQTLKSRPEMDTWLASRNKPIFGGLRCYTEKEIKKR